MMGSHRHMLGLEIRLDEIGILRPIVEPPAIIEAPPNTLTSMRWRWPP